MPTKQTSPNWQTILWREWRNCGNSAYAKQLFALLADTPVSWGAKTIYIALDTVVGLVIAVLLGFIWTTDGLFLQQLAWAGGVIGAARGLLAVRNLSWRDWLERLAFGLPSQQPNAGIAAILGLMLIGGMIFGPFFWLFLIGLFWGMSSLIKWMMQGLISAKPFDYQAWYFWWRRRPAAAEVELALQQAYQAEAQRAKLTTPPGVHPPNLSASPPAEIDFLQLKQYARSRETRGT